MTRAEIITELKDIHIKFYAFTDYRKTLEACLKMLEEENALLEDVLKIIHQKGISNAYDRLSFWYNKGKDYKVIDTKYHRGYDQALADVEEEVLALRKENKE